MISKQFFVELINAIEAQSKLDDRNGDILTELADPEFQSYKVISTTPMIDTVVKSMSKELSLPNDSGIGDDISYYIWDLRFGKDPMAIGCITRSDGTKVSLTSPEALYDWIIYDKGNAKQ